jgi:hypothetical protein
MDRLVPASGGTPNITVRAGEELHHTAAPTEFSTGTADADVFVGQIGAGVTDDWRRAAPRRRPFESATGVVV